VAEPSFVAKSTVTVVVAAADRVTANVASVVPVLPSSTASPAMAIDAESSSTIVTVARPVAIVDFTGFSRSTWKTSSGSLAVSPLTPTAIVCSVSPGRNVATPVCAA
jgi:hypothetical protein